MDGRRSRWIAFDAFFLHDDLGQEVLDRFGTTGVVLFLGFLCACKRNPVPGRITYASDSEALILMGCQGLELTNERGETYDLETFWTFLGHRKQTRRTARGRLKHVESTKWAKWQKDLGRQTEAEKKASSRRGNTPDSAPTVSGQPADDTPPIGGTDIDLDIDPDKDNDRDRSSSSRSDFNSADSAYPDDDDLSTRLDKASATLADQRLEALRRDQPNHTIGSLPKWMAATTAGVRTELVEWVNADAVTRRKATVDELVASGMPEPTAKPHPLDGIAAAQAKRCEEGRAAVQTALAVEPAPPEVAAAEIAKARAAMGRRAG